MPLKLPHKKKKDNAPQQEAEATEQQSVKRGAGKKKDHTEAKHRLRNTAFALIVVVLLGVIGCMIASQFFPEISVLDLPRRVVANVMRPVEEAFSSGTGWFFDYVKRLKLRSNIEYEYEKLYEQYDDMLSQVMRVNELENQLNEYQDLMDEMQTHSQFDGVPARVIASDSTNYFSTFTINVGTKQGIQNYMAVVKSGGLVGYTYDVTETTAKVQSVISSDTSISALIESTRYQGTVKGTLGVNGEAMCRMYYLPEENLPRPGDQVVTSGVGMSFPKGIPIGTVRESTRGMESNKQYIVVEPSADFQHIEYVIVLRYQPEAEAVEDRSSSTDSLTLVPLETILPVPTVLIGSDTYQLAPSPTPSPEPTLAPDETPAPTGTASTPGPSSSGGDSYEYKVPSGLQNGATDNSYGFTLAPTATPTPTAPPLDLSVEED